MNGSLLNIWREIGAYLRYGDAKCLFLAGVSFSLLVSFLRHSLIDEGLSWQIYSNLRYASIGPGSWLAIVAFSLAFVAAALATVPSLSRGLVRARLINRIGNLFSRTSVERPRSAVIYFLEIARYENAEAYGAALQRAVALKQAGPGDEELVEQIWIIAQIAASKFMAANISIVAIIVGLVFALA